MLDSVSKKALKPGAMKRPVSIDGDNVHVPLPDGEFAIVTLREWRMIERGESFGPLTGPIGWNWCVNDNGKGGKYVKVKHRFPGHAKADSVPLARLLSGLGPCKDEMLGWAAGDERTAHLRNRNYRDLRPENRETRSRDDNPFVKAARALADAKWKAERACEAERVKADRGVKRAEEKLAREAAKVEAAKVEAA